MAQYAYSRVSTEQQVTENQVLRLQELYPHAAIFQETASGVKDRPVLKSLLALLKPGDELIVSSLDRLGRRTSEVLALIEDLQAHGVVLKSLREGIDLGTPVGKLVTSVLVSVAALERDLIAERTRLALDARRKQGVKLGRKPTYSPETIEQVKALRASGFTVREVSRRTGVSPGWVSKLSKAA